MTLSVVDVITSGIMVKSYDSDKTLYSIAVAGTIQKPTSYDDQ